MTFNKVTEWLAELQENAHENIHICLVGNKTDLEKQREVSYQEGFNFAKTNNLKFTETCAFDLSSIEPLFTGMAEDIIKEIQQGKIDPNDQLTGIKIGPALLVGGKNKGNGGVKINNKGSTKTKKKGCS